eukprot:745897-Hanusia_phi.AAC.7
MAVEQTAIIPRSIMCRQSDHGSQLAHRITSEEDDTTDKRNDVVRPLDVHYSSSKALVSSKITWSAIQNFLAMKHVQRDGE